MKDVAFYQDYQFWLLVVQTLGILAAAAGIIYQVYKSRETAKRIKAFDTINSAEFLPLHEEGLCVLRKYNDSGQTVGRLIEDNECEDLRSEKDKVLALLNHYEYLSSGIRLNIVCEETVRKTNFSSFMEVFESSNELILGLRKRNKRQSIFCELEWLYKRWAKASLDGRLPKLD